MKKTVKSMAALGMTVMMLGSLCACGSGQTPAPSAAAGTDTAGTTAAPAQTAAPAPGGSVENYTWGSASMGGSAQLVITAIGTLVSDKNPGLNVNVQSTGGSMENPRLLRGGDIDIAHTGEPYNAFFGKGRFEPDGPMPEDTMVLMKTYPAGGLFVVKGDSPIETMEDLAGKSIYLGPPAGMIDQVKLLLEYYGVTEENSDFVIMGYNEGADALKDGTVDAAFCQYAGSQPASTTAQLDETCDIRPLELSEEYCKQLNERYSDYGYYIASAGTIKKQDKDLPVTCTWNTQLCNSKLSEEAAYLIVKTAYENVEELKKSHALCGELDKENPLYGVPKAIPIHPGAAKYYKETGTWSDEYTVGELK